MAAKDKARKLPKGKQQKQTANASSSRKNMAPKAAAVPSKRKYLSQGDVPSYSLTQALRIPRAIGEHYGYKPTSPLNVAAALNVSPTSGPFRQLCGAAIAYGLTKGGYSAPTIELEPLGMRIARPTQEGDDLQAKREALLKPKVVGEFLRKYDGAPLPREDIGSNVLHDMGVPSDKIAEVHALILDGAESVGILRIIKDKRYVDLTGVPVTASSDGDKPDEPETDEPEEDPATDSRRVQLKAGAAAALPQIHSGDNAKRVFVTHGKNKAFIDPIKKLLGFGEMEAVVSVEKTSVSQPVPDKVMNDMRRCGSAIIHVDAELTLIDKEAKEHTVLNPNVLIEIGAAMALYGRRFILLVRDGVKLPSNLQGLFEVRYASESLDGDATIRLLEAINDIKNHPIPNRYDGSN